MCITWDLPPLHQGLLRVKVKNTTTRGHPRQIVVLGQIRRSARIIREKCIIQSFYMVCISNSICFITFLWKLNGYQFFVFTRKVTKILGRGGLNYRNAYVIQALLKSNHRVSLLYESNHYDNNFNILKNVKHWFSCSRFLLKFNWTKTNAANELKSCLL